MQQTENVYFQTHPQPEQDLFSSYSVWLSTVPQPDKKPVILKLGIEVKCQENHALCGVLVCITVLVCGVGGCKWRHLYLNNGTAVLLKVGRWVCHTDPCTDYTEALCSLVGPNTWSCLDCFTTLDSQKALRETLANKLS